MATLTIWHGRKTPLRAVGVHQTRLLGFASKYPGWHCYAKDRATVRAVQGLLRRGAIKLNEFDQFHINYQET